MYRVEYRVTFAGRHHRGNVPTIALTTSSALTTYSSTYGGYEADDGGGVFGYLSSCCDASCSTSCPEELGPVYLDDQYAYEIVEGNQPDGSIKLEYECEARTTKLDSVSATSGSTAALLTGARRAVLKGDWIRVAASGADSYYEIAKVHAQGATDANVTLASPYVGATSASRGPFFLGEGARFPVFRRDGRPDRRRGGHLLLGPDGRGRRVGGVRDVARSRDGRDQRRRVGGDVLVVAP